MDNTIEVVTPSGHKVYLKTFLSFSDKRQIQKIWASGISVDAKTKEEKAELSGTAIYEAQDLTLKLMIKRLVTSEGQVFDGISAFEVIMGDTFPEQDGNVILDKIDEITASNQITEESKKKSKITSTNSTKQEEE